jgi:hypothetical protein
MFELKKENDTYLMTIEKIKYANNSEYWLELTNKKTLMTQTLMSKTKKALMFKNYELESIANKLNNWKIPKQKAYKKINKRSLKK